MSSVKQRSIVVFADSAFANMPGSKSQCGHIGFLVDSVADATDLDFRKTWTMWWSSGRVKRVVRSTLAAEGYAVSEAVEHAIYLQRLISEIESAPGSQQSQHGFRKLPIPIRVVSDSQSLVTTVQRDTGAGQHRRFAIVLAMLREVFASKNDEQCELIWTPTGKMVADGLTKVMSSALLSCACGSRKFE